MQDLLLFNNKEILVGGRPVFIKELFDSNILSIDCFHDPIMQPVLGGSLHKNNTSCLLLGLYHASVNWLSIVLMQIPPPPPKKKKWTVLWDRWKKRI